MSHIILTDNDNGVTTVTLNRPENLNALSLEMTQAIVDTFLKLKDDEETRVIILTGAGRAFTAGLDLKELGQKGLGNGSRKVTGGDLQQVVRDVGKPVIGAINGYAITGGFELALMCDILIASSHAKFADTHVRMGVVPGWGLSQRLSQLVGSSRAKELSFTGNYIDADTACAWGLVNRVLPPEELLPHCKQLAIDICSAEPITLKEVHRLIDYGSEYGLSEGLREEARATAAHKKIRDVSADTLEVRRQQVQQRGRTQVK
jgi:enoyl-CoA hydratase|tara:strand:+ start:262 stop:1044 length:783 start_codon:yes stop_codon:yes gene_type:complete